MRKTFFYLLSLFLCNYAVSQIQRKLNPLLISFRIPLQIDFQKEYISHLPINSSNNQSATAFNYGVDFLVEKEICKNINLHLGVGYFRDKFHLNRFYDHQLLNPTTDSIPIGLAITNYTYNLIRFPAGVSYSISSNLKLGTEFILNYSFENTYGKKNPFQGVNNNKRSNFYFFGNSINIFLSIAVPVSDNSAIIISPYIRVYNTYRKDIVLYENPHQSISHYFDGTGLSLKYSLNLKNIK